jgi:hypothetical protein
MLKLILATVGFFLMGGVATAQNTIISTYGDPGNYTITVQKTPEGKKFVRYEGNYVPLSGAALVAAIQLTPDLAYLEISSMGGLLGEIERPVMEIERLKLPIVIRAGEVCASACAFMALASPDIRVEGLLAFHLPYNDNWAKETSIYDISQSNVEMTIKMSRQLFNQKWRLILYYTIQQNSGLDNWLVFTDTENLDYFRFTDPNDFVAQPEQPAQVTMMTTAEVLATLASQAVDNTP